jgi:hypothetical protein
MGGTCHGGIVCPVQLETRQTYDAEHALHYSTSRDTVNARFSGFSHTHISAPTGYGAARELLTADR